MTVYLWSQPAEDEPSAIQVVVQNARGVRRYLSRARPVLYDDPTERGHAFLDYWVKHYTALGHTVLLRRPTKPPLPPGAAGTIEKSPRWKVTPKIPRHPPKKRSA